MRAQHLQAVQRSPPFGLRPGSCPDYQQHMHSISLRSYSDVVTKPSHTTGKIAQVHHRFRSRPAPIPASKARANNWVVEIPRAACACRHANLTNSATHCCSLLLTDLRHRAAGRSSSQRQQPALRCCARHSTGPHGPPAPGRLSFRAPGWARGRPALFGAAGNASKADELEGGPLAVDEFYPMPAGVNIAEWEVAVFTGPLSGLQAASGSTAMGRHASPRFLYSSAARAAYPRRRAAPSQVARVGVQSRHGYRRPIQNTVV